MGSALWGVAETPAPSWATKRLGDGHSNGDRGMKAKEFPPAPPIDSRYWEDMDWAYEHYATLAAEHPNQWVAVLEGRVVAAGVNLGEVESVARGIAGRKDVAVVFIERGIHVYDHSAGGSEAG